MLERHKEQKKRARLNPLKTAVNGRDSDVLAMVERALRHKEVLLAFQPVVLAGNHRRLAFHEGLIRVLDDTGRIIPAKDFIGAIEGTELGRQVDCLALELGLRELARYPNLRLSINLSAPALYDRRWLKTLEHGLARLDTIAERLILEITEATVMADPEQVLPAMDALQMRGISFALDDFGAGQTALRYFTDFDFDILKIDGRFVRGIDSSADKQAIASALTSIGKHFDMFTVAEHVESQREAKTLAKIGIDCLQGYFFGAPTISPPWHSAPCGKKRA
jgi:EAL domain-containing protein (putative c-di-GMP-specific phosphodiesterase class I)